MAHDVVFGTHTARDWSLGIGDDDQGDDQGDEGPQPLPALRSPTQQAGQFLATLGLWGWPQAVLGLAVDVLSRAADD